MSNLVIFDGDQGSEEWHQFRLGSVSASSISKVLAGGQGKTRLSYMYQLIGERITGEKTQAFKGNEHTERGHEMEPIARVLYAKTSGENGFELGSMRNFDDIGGVVYSPDWVIGENGLAEIKSRLPHIQSELLDTGKIPSDAMKQMQCGLWISEREWCDYVSYWPGMPLFIERVYRDEELIKKMREAVIQFYRDMNAKIRKIAGEI